MARPRSPDGELRSPLHLLLTAEEKAWIKDRARKHERSMSGEIVHMFHHWRDDRGFAGPAGALRTAVEAVIRARTEGAEVSDEIVFRLATAYNDWRGAVGERE